MRHRTAWYAHNLYYVKSSIQCLCLTLLLHSPIAFSEDTVWQVDGLEHPVEIRVDRWGIPHIYAEAHYDAFFAQGFNAARDRLWQIDLWRRRGLGQLSEILGSAFLEQDEAARLFLYRGDMFREWLAYGSDAKRIATSFARGVNAYIDLTVANPGLLPVEFRILDYAPARWQPSDIVRIRSNGLWRNVLNEIERARIVCRYGLDVDARRFQLEPAWKTVVPEGLDPCAIPEEAGHLYRLARTRVDFSRAIQFRNSGQRQMAAMKKLVLDDQESGAGSNNWVIAPARTATGRPVLANDPHRGHAVPSLRYAVHLVAPGLNVIGAGEPALPGVSIGHNDRIAFGLTIFPIDQEDLMVYRRKGNRYRYRDRWESFRTVRETFHVRGGKPVTRELRFTRHGPVIHRNTRLAFAVQAAWLEPGTAPYFGSVEYMRASNWREFLAALNRWGAPSENQVYADIDGNIGYKPAGLAPVRTGYDGLLPVPGDGRYEWRGFYDMDELPVVYNPPEGWAGTANAMSLPADYPYREKKLGFEWAYPWRIQRMREVLDTGTAHTIADSLALQRDYLSLPARQLLSLVSLEALPSPADRLFRDWDFRLERNSSAAALFEIWFSSFLNRAVLSRALEIPDIDGIGTLHNNRVVALFRAMDARERQEIASVTLEQAVSRASALMGSDPSRWAWGKVHTIHFTHPLYHYVGKEQQALLYMPPVSRGGSGDTLNSTRYRNDFTITSGASWRMVLDVGNWDNAWMTNTPGQSGVPGTRHYSDLLSVWADDEALPLVFSRERVEKHTEQIIFLEPRKPESEP